MVRGTESTAYRRRSLRIFVRLRKAPQQRPPGRLHHLVKAGIRALEAGDRPRAIELCRQILDERPDMARGHYLAGLIALDANDRDQAEQAFARTVELNERHSGAWAQLARLYLTAGRFAKAEGCLENAVKTHRGKAAVKDLIGSVFRLAGNLRASHQWHVDAAETAPDKIPILVNLANSHFFLGNADESRAVLERCVELEPDNALVHWLISRASAAASGEHLDAMRRLLSKQSDPRSLAYLWYAIGKESEDLDDWKSAWQAYTEGAAARRKSIAYDEGADEALFSTLETQLTRDWFDAAHSDCYDNGPVFIVGLPRTGSTLLDRMLDAHPVAQSAGELRHFGYALREVTGVDEPRQFSSRLVESAVRCDRSSLGEAYLQSTSSLRSGAPHVIDKLPSNYLHLPLIAASMPNATIVHIRRGAMDTCFAIYKQLFADAYLYSYDLGELGRQYVRYDTLMRAWRDRFGECFVEVWYEDLVSNTEDTLRTLLETIGLSWNEACLDYAGRDTATSTPSAGQVREAPHTRSVGRWKRFESELAPLQEILDTAGIPFDKA